MLFRSIVLIYIIGMLLRKNKNFNINENTPEIIKWKWLLVAFLCLIPLGILNGAHIQEQIRLIRNLLYIIIIYYILIENKENINPIFLIEYISIISIADCIVQTIVLHNNSNWYQFYRANGVLNVFLFCFLIFKIWNMNKKEFILGIFCCIGLIYSSFLSQERTQLLTIAITMTITFIYQLYYRLFKLKQLKIKLKTIKKIVAIIILCSIIIYILLQINFVKEYIEYYFKYRLNSGNLFQNDTLQSDGSFEGRTNQIITIWNDNLHPLYMIFGKGTCAHYIAIQGETYIVDGVITWIFKDLGFIGIFLIISIFYYMLKGYKNIEKESKSAIYSSCISLIIFSIFNPSFIYVSSAAFTFGLYSFLKYISIKDRTSY